MKGLLFFMNWCNVDLQLSFLWKFWITATTAKGPFLFMYFSSVIIQKSISRKLCIANTACKGLFLFMNCCNMFIQRSQISKRILTIATFKGLLLFMHWWNVVFQSFGSWIGPFTNIAFQRLHFKENLKKFRLFFNALKISSSKWKYNQKLLSQADTDANFYII